MQQDQPSQHDVTGTPIPRRVAVAGAGMVAIAGVAACSGGSSADGDDQGTAPDQGTVLGDSADVKVGGGQVFADAEVVVTQPEQGEFKGFSAVCTHQGCIVENVAGGTINCNCHGSKFDAADGTVRQGPATRPLPEQPVSVNAKGEIVVA